MKTRAEKFFEEFYKHTVSSGVGHLLLKDQALYMLRGVFENWPYLEGAINKENKYRINVLKSDFELFFVPAIQRLYED
jgi:hypothetical protein